MNAKTWMTESGQLYLCDEKNVEISRVIFNYIRDKNNRKVGVVVATQLSVYEPVRFGYAKYNPKKEKGKPNSDFAFDVAIGRMLRRNDILFPFENKEYPTEVKKHLKKLYERANSYFHAWRNEVSWEEPLENLNDLYV